MLATKKRAFTLIIMSILIVTILFMGLSLNNNNSAYAMESDYWTYYKSAGFSIGNGSSIFPFEINSAEDLALLSYNVAQGVNYSNKYFALTQDIDLSDYLWEPIGNALFPFQGRFNGNNHIISGMTIDETDGEYQGLFGVIASGASVEKIGLIDGSIRANQYVGAIAGYNIGVIDSCFNNNIIDAEGLTIGEYIGGIAGYNAGTITHSFNRGEVKGIEYVGGIAGYNLSEIGYTYNASLIESEANDGAIAGFNDDDGTIAFSYYDNDIYIGNATNNNNGFSVIGLSTINMLCTDAPGISSSLVGFTTSKWKANASEGIYSFYPALLAFNLDITTLNYIKVQTKGELLFDSNGGEDGNITSVIINLGESIIDNLTSIIDGEEVLPSRQGYTFIGWADEQGDELDDTIIMSEIGFTVYAQWEANQYTLTFNSNGGINGLITEVQAPYGEKISDYLTSSVNNGASAMPTRTGYTFSGWTKSGGAAITDDDIMGIDGFMVYASWTINSYELIFDNNGGVDGTIISRQVPYGARIRDHLTALLVDGGQALPSKTGYTFSGWTKEGGATITDADLMGLDGFTVYAYWAPNDYTLTFNSNGGDDGSVTIKNVPYGAKISDYLTTTSDEEGTLPTMQGYTFLNWTKEGGEAITDSDLMTEAGFTVYAEWTVGFFTLTFDNNGGVDGSITSIEVQYGEKILDYLTSEQADGIAALPYKVGHSFNGWTKLLGVALTDGDVMGEEGFIVYAQWNVLSYSLVFDSNGGVDGTVTSVEVTYGAQIIDYLTSQDYPEQLPTRDFYTFNGWLNEDNSVITELELMSEEGYTVYASWLPIEYLLTFDAADGVDGNVTSVLVPYGALISDYITNMYDEPGTLPSKIGYNFGVWVKEDGVELDYTDVMTEEGFTVYATYSIINYQITYVTYSGSNNADNPHNYNILDDDIIFADASLRGYDFIGWYDSEDELTRTRVTMIASGSYGAITIYAVYEAREIVVSFETYGNGMFADITVIFGTVYGELPIPIKEGYTFLGWDLHIGVNNALSFEIKDTTVVDSVYDHMLYAKFIINRYTVTFNSMGGGTIAPRQVYYNNTMTEPTMPVRLGYYFHGWFYMADSVEYKWDFQTDKVKGDFELYAKWACYFNSGLGTQSSPFIISNVSELNTLSSYVNNNSMVTIDGIVYYYREAYYELDRSIINVGAFTPIGNSVNTFKGSFNGKGYTISGLNITQVSAYAGLFGYLDIDGVIINTGVINGSVSGASYVGGIVGYNAGFVSNCYNALNISGYSEVGGIVGFSAAYATVSNVYNLGNIQGTSSVGGLIGRATNNSILENGFSVGSIIASASSTGGIVGYTYDSTVLNCYYNTDVYSGNAIGLIQGTLSSFNLSGLTTIEMVYLGNVDSKLFGEHISWSYKEYSDGEYYYPALSVFGENYKQIIIYTVAFKVDDNIYNIQYVTPSYSTPLIQPDNPVKPNKHFVYWETEQNYRWDFSSDTAVSTLILNAFFVDNEYTVTFNTNDGTVLPSQTILHGEYAAAPTTIPTLLGHTFVGWYTSQDLDTPYSFSSMAIVANTIIYAKWSVNTYTITYVTNGGASVSAQTIPYGSEISAPTSIKTGHSLNGWYTSQALDTLYVFDTMPADNITLYAGWTVDIYTVIIVIDGEEIEQNVNFGANAVLPKKEPKKDGYTFIGWDTLNTNVSDDLTINAIFEPIVYTITFNTNGGSSVESVNAAYESAISAPTTAPTREGYVFTGWYSDRLTSREYTFDTMPASNITLYAGWELEGNSSTLNMLIYGGSAIGFFVLVFAIVNVAKAIKKKKVKA